MGRRLPTAASLLLLAAGCQAPAPGPDPRVAGSPIDLLRSDLRSADATRALAAARSLGPGTLSLEEIRLQTALLARTPEAVFKAPGQGSGLASAGADSLGSPDVVPLLEALVADGDRAFDADALRQIHRRALPDHIPDIVRLLEPARGERYLLLLWLLRNLAENTDRHREEVAGALLYARAAWVAEADARPGPRLADFRSPDTGITTAAEFLRRYESLLAGRDATGFHEEFPRAWLARWEWEAVNGPRPERSPTVEAEAFSPAEARAKISELAERPMGAWRDDDRPLESLLPLLEVSDPAALDQLLARWAEAPVEEHRILVAAWRARRAAAPDPAGEAGVLLAALDRGEEPGPSIARLGRLGARGRPALERFRRERARGLYWSATAGLAIAGDAAARAEFLAMLRDDRISIFDTDLDEVGLTLDGNPEVLDHWLSRLDANCCLRFWADGALRSLHPTMPEANTVEDADVSVQRVQDWFERWRGRFRWSRLAGGLVPSAE